MNVTFHLARLDVLLELNEDHGWAVIYHVGILTSTTKGSMLILVNNSKNVTEEVVGNNLLQS